MRHDFTLNVSQPASQPVSPGRFIGGMMSDPWIPNPCHDVASCMWPVRDGDWEDETIWNDGSVPTVLDNVIIPEGVVVNAQRLYAKHVLVQGQLGLLDGLHAIVTTIVVLGDDALLLADEISGEVIFGGALDLQNDPGQYWGGLLLLGGTVRLSGIEKTPYVQWDGAIYPGDNAIETFGDGWRRGDEIIIPQTEKMRKANVKIDGKIHMVPFSDHQFERFQIESFSGGDAILDGEVQHEHKRGGYYDTPYPIANMTRSLVFKSGSLDGHILVGGWCVFSMKNCRLENLGRTLNTGPTDDTTWDNNGNATHVGTNQIARYPMHFHHCRRTGEDAPQFIGNVIDQGDEDHDKKWLLACHHTDDSLILRNVTYNHRGGGIVFEDGSESYNRCEENLIMLARGDDVWREAGSNSKKVDARSASGIWCKGPRNRVNRNIIIGMLPSYNRPSSSYGIKYFCENVGYQYVTNQHGETFRYNEAPILECDGNVTISCQAGLTWWWLQSSNATPASVPGTRCEISNFTSVNHFERSVFPYQFTELTLRNFTNDGSARNLAGTDYHGRGLRIIGMRSRGTISGQHDLSFVFHSDIYLEDIDVERITIRPQFRTNGNQNNLQWYRVWTIKNISPTTMIEFEPQLKPDGTPMKQAQFIGYTKVTLDGTRLYADAQHPDQILPQYPGNSTGRPLVSVPDAGMTNYEAFAKYRARLPIILDDHVGRPIVMPDASDDPFGLIGDYEPCYFGKLMPDNVVEHPQVINGKIEGD